MIQVAVMGYGTIGSGVVEVLETNKDKITEKTGKEIAVKYILDLREFPGDPHEAQIVHDFEIIEKDEEKKKEYVDVLERKSMRLKVLIEDLFDISKASSKNITLNLTDVDVVNLFKQVKLELDEKIEKTDLEFKCNYPEEKMMAVLDGQKTYRIFENLIVNVTKYAMPHTRVFVDIFREENEIVVQMKNVSKDELTFNPQEITERFVRGDESRNSEGSGLGLAIVRSFTELQGGHFHVETEADLFKAEIRWPWKNK